MFWTKPVAAVFLIVLISLALGCGSMQVLRKELYRQSSDFETCKLKINLDKRYPGNIYIPKDLDDCMIELDKLLCPEARGDIRDNPWPDVEREHGILRDWMMKYWQLNRRSRLADYFEEQGVCGPSWMTNVIFHAYEMHVKVELYKADDLFMPYRKLCAVIQSGDREQLQELLDRLRHVADSLEAIEKTDSTKSLPK